MAFHAFLGGSLVLALVIPGIRRPGIFEEQRKLSEPTRAPTADETPNIPPRTSSSLPPYAVESPVARRNESLDPPSTAPFAANAADQPAQLTAGGTYESIYFSGCGYLLPYHFGVVAALRDRGVAFQQAVGTSGGVMAALAMLGGADLELGLRQCFDLRDEPAAMPWVLQSFFARYRKYFRAFRSPSLQAALPLAELRGRLFVRLGKAAHLLGVPVGGWEVFQVTDFADEGDLEDAFMSAAYVPGATAFTPPGFRGRVAFDAAFVDTFFTAKGSEGKGYVEDNASLFPSTPSPPAHAPPLTPAAAAAGVFHGSEDDARKKPTRVVVVPNDPASLDPAGKLVVIKGAFKQGFGDFFADHATMRRGFEQGYAAAAAMVDTSALPPTEQHRLAAKVQGAGAFVDRVMADHAGWMQDHGVVAGQAGSGSAPLAPAAA